MLINFFANKVLSRKFPSCINHTWKNCSSKFRWGPRCFSRYTNYLVSSHNSNLQTGRHIGITSLLFVCPSVCHLFAKLPTGNTCVPLKTPVTESDVKNMKRKFQQNSFTDALDFTTLFIIWACHWETGVHWPRSRGVLIPEIFIRPQFDPQDISGRVKTL